MKTTLNIIALFATVATCLAAEADSIRFSAVSNEATPTTKEMIYEYRGEARTLFVEATPIIAERDIAIVERVSDSPSAIKIILTESGEKKFNEGIKDMQGKQLAIIIKNKIVSAPVLQATAFGREITIDGNLTTEEADSLVSNFNKTNG